MARSPLRYINNKREYATPKKRVGVLPSAYLASCSGGREMLGHKLLPISHAPLSVSAKQPYGYLRFFLAKLHPGVS